MTNLKRHLKERNVNLELYPDCVVCEETNTFTMYLWNLSGQLLGFQTYKPNKPKNDKNLNPRDQRYFTFVAKNSQNSNQLTAWGLHLLNPKKRNLFVCEGFADAVRLHNLGLNGLALLACDPKPLKSWLWTLGYNVVPVCEGDKAGLKLKKLSNNGDVVFLEENKDLGDLTDKELKETFKRFF